MRFLLVPAIATLLTGCNLAMELERQAEALPVPRAPVATPIAAQAPTQSIQLVGVSASLRRGTEVGAYVANLWDCMPPTETIYWDSGPVSIRDRAFDVVFCARMTQGPYLGSAEGQRVGK